MEIQFPPSSLRSMLASPIWPRRPERAYMDILKNAPRPILRRHTLRWMKTFRGVTTNLAGLVTRRPSWQPWPCRRFRVRPPARGRFASATDRPGQPMLDDLQVDPGWAAAIGAAAIPSAS